jgi:hypothetical protein
LTGGGAGTHRSPSGQTNLPDRETQFAKPPIAANITVMAGALMMAAATSMSSSVPGAIAR